MSSDTDFVYPFKAFVFEGGGTTAFGHQGAIDIFEKYNLLHQIKYFIGSSSGAFVAAALACGGTPKETSQLLKTTDFEAFLDDSWGICRDLNRLVRKFGWFRGDYVEKWFGGILKNITGNENITFKEAYDKTENHLTITTTDFTTGEMLFMNYLTTPDLSIKTAIRRTTALPIIFKPDSPFEDVDIMVDNQVVTKHIQRCYVDGGMLDNYPLYYFDDFLKPEEIVGFKLMTSSELSEVTNPFIDAVNPTYPKNLRDFLMRFLIVIINKNYKLHIPQKDWERTVKIDTENHSPIDFSLDQKDKDFMLKQGRIAAEKFLKDFRNRPPLYSVQTQT